MKVNNKKKQISNKLKQDPISYPSISKDLTKKLKRQGKMQ